MSSDKPEPCPFCGSNALYDDYQMVGARLMPFVYCGTCGAMVTFEGSEDWVTEESDGMDELDAHWDNRPGAHVRLVAHGRRDGGVRKDRKGDAR